MVKSVGKKGVLKLVSEFYTNFSLPFVGRILVEPICAGSNAPKKSGFKLGEHTIAGSTFCISTCASPGMASLESHMRMPAWCVKSVKPSKYDPEKPDKKQFVPTCSFKRQDINIKLPIVIWSVLKDSSLKFEDFDDNLCLSVPYLAPNPDAFEDSCVDDNGVFKRPLTLENEDEEKEVLELTRFVQPEEIRVLSEEEKGLRDDKVANKKFHAKLLEENEGEAEDCNK